MARIPGIRRFFRLPSSASRVERDIDEELEFHLAAQIDELRARGLLPDEARREALRRFGDISASRAELRAIDGRRLRGERRAEWWSSAWQDLRYSVRGLRARPGFASVVIVTLGLGVGANATMFGIVDRLLLRPPTYLSDADRTGRIYLEQTTGEGERRTSDRTGYARYIDLRDGTTSFSQLVASATQQTVLGIGANATQVRLTMASANLWLFFNVRPALGRFFLPDEDRLPSGAPVVVLGYALWRESFGADPAVIGRTVRIGPNSYTVIGVAPRDFTGVELTRVDAWVPLTTMAARVTGLEFATSYNVTWLQLVGRLAPGVHRAEANADLTAAYGRSLRRAPNALPLERSRPRAEIGSILVGRGPKADKNASVATWLAGVSLIVLLIACANVANLLLARALQRQREIAVRIAMGVSRGRLLSQLLIESVVLASLGGVAGLVIAQWGGGILRTLLVPDIAWPTALTDRRMLLFTASAALVTGIVSGLAPALHASRPDLTTALKSGAREGGVRRSWLRTSLLIAQAALSVVLLVGAGLFVRSLRNVQHLELGYQPARIAEVDIDLRGRKLDSAGQRALFERIRERLASVPGVEYTGGTMTVPFYISMNLDISVPGLDTASLPNGVDANRVSGDYFAAMGIRLLRGRVLDARDRAGSARTAVISEQLAKRLWPNDDPLGRCIRVGGDKEPCSTVVGLVTGVRNSDLHADPSLHVYTPQAQSPVDPSVLMVRTGGDARDMMLPIQRALQPVVPSDAYVNVHPLEDLVAPEIRPWRLGATMFGALGALALVLAAVGLYGVIAYDVAQRSHELGIRMALGARSTDLLRLVVLQGVRIAAIGMAVGLALSLAAGHWLAPLLFNVSPNDSATLACVAATLLAVALLATFVPAMRAARVEPSVVLRDG